MVSLPYNPDYQKITVTLDLEVKFIIEKLKLFY